MIDCVFNWIFVIMQYLRFLLLMLLCPALFPFATIQAQTEEPQWVPGLLNAKASTIFSISNYYGWPIGWASRANERNTQIIINGIDWHSSLPGFNARSVYMGLQEVLTKEQLVENFAYAENGFGNLHATQYFSSFSNAKTKQKKMNWTSANNARLGTLGLNWNTGRMKNNWVVQTYLNYQQHTHTQASLGFAKAYTAAISLDKIIKANQNLNFLVWHKEAQQSKKSMVSKELTEITNDKEYNPTWGWYHGQAWYPNTRKMQSLNAQFTYLKQFLNGGFLQGSVGVLIGKQTERNLEWNGTKDPRPDYYKYLPSYYIDSNLQISILKRYQEHPLLLQLQGDALEKLNLSSKDGSAYYIVNASNAKSYFLKMNWDYSHPIFKNANLDLHIHYSNESIYYYDQVDQLLGGKYFYNYNAWVDDEGKADYNQFDMQHPNRKIQVNEKWGPNYRLLHHAIQSTNQFKWAMAKWEWSLSAQLGSSLYQRIGYQQNGLFPNASFGKSEWLQFPDWGLKGQGLYKISGRHYIRSILFQQAEAPAGKDLFLNPSLQQTVAPFLRPLENKGVDLQYMYRGVPLQSTLGFYTGSAEGIVGHHLFYHDFYHAFVYGAYGQSILKRMGVEWSLETLIKERLEFKVLTTYNHSVFVNEPLYQLLLVNNLFAVESGILRIKNLPASTSPNWVTAFSIASQISPRAKIGITGVAAYGRFVAYDYFRRSSLWLSKMGDMQGCVVEVPKYDPAFLLHLYMSSSHTFLKRNNNLRWVLNVKNVLNNRLPVWAAEQARFDYINYRLQKFPVKYLFDQGLSISVQIQLIIP